MGARLRRLLRLRRQSIRAFSEATGVPYRTLQDYLADKGKPGADQLARIARAGVDVNFLLTGKTPRLGYLIRADAPADDDAYYVLTDPEVMDAIIRKAQQVITIMLREQIELRQSPSFDELLTAYSNLISDLAYVFARSEPPLEDARKAGISVSNIIDSILDASAQIVATRLLVRGRSDK